MDDRYPLFDDVIRTMTHSQRHRESIFEFFNRIGGEFWAQPRGLMQKWADHLPDAKSYRDIRGMIRSGDDGQFRGAFLELYLHEFLTRTGHNVIVHLSVPSGDRRPDFLVEREGRRYYLEAVAPNVTPSQKVSAARQASLLDAIDGVGDPRFFLDLEDMEIGRSMPRSAQARTSIRRWLDLLDPDDPSNSPASAPFT